MNSSELQGLVLIIILGSLSIACGLGGGIITLPLLLIFFRLETKQAVAITNLIVLINSFTKYVSALEQNDPLKPSKKLIDYQMLLIFNPILVASTVIGGILNKALPEGVIIIFLLLIGTPTIFINIFNGIKLFIKESAQNQKN